MCLFPLPNENFNSLAYKKGVREFDCGSCPECMRKRSNLWALRAVYESKSHVSNLMVTLTYDKFKYSDRRNNEELPVNPNIVCNKRHIQLFIKRLRKYLSTHSVLGVSSLIKYLCTAEYGSRTHRAHYHLILFGVNFPDIHYYKKSKRGNVIYMSSILTKLWSHGICTIDSINVSGAIARYCTKYCAKSRSNDTFMLCSQNIGIDNLLKAFNGKSYWIEGREYSIPRNIWEHYIMSKYNRYSSIVSPKYINYDRSTYSHWLDDFRYMKSKADRKRYRYLRDRDPLYIQYLEYWNYKGKSFEQNKLKPLQRIYLLDDSKYHNYRIAALKCYRYRSNYIPVPAPGSNCVSAYERYKDKIRPRSYDFELLKRLSTCPLPPRPNRASDTIFYKLDPFLFEPIRDFIKFEKIYPKKLLTNNAEQVIFDI